MEPHIYADGHPDRYGMAQNLPQSTIANDPTRQFQHPVGQWRDPNMMMPRLNWDGDEAFRNQKRLISRFVDGLVLTANEEFLTTRLLPIMPVTSTTITWEKVTYNDAIMQRTPYEAPSNYLTQSREAFSEVISRRGIAIFGENDWMGTPEGMTDMLNLAWKMNLVRLKTMNLSVISACLNAKNVYRDWQERAGLYTRSVNDVFKYEKHLFAIVNKPVGDNYYGFKVMVDLARESMKVQSRGTDPNMLVLPSGIIGFYQEPLIPELTDYMHIGPDGKQELRTRPPPLTTIGGIDLYELGPDVGRPGEKNPQLLMRNVSVGEHYRMCDTADGYYPAGYTSDHRSILIYDEPLDEWKKIRLMDAIDGCFRFKGNRKKAGGGGGGGGDDGDDDDHYDYGNDNDEDDGNGPKDSKLPDLSKTGLVREALDALDSICEGRAQAIEANARPVVDAMIYAQGPTRRRAVFMGDLPMERHNDDFFLRAAKMVANRMLAAISHLQDLQNAFDQMIDLLKPTSTSTTPFVGKAFASTAVPLGACCYLGMTLINDKNAIRDKALQYVQTVHDKVQAMFPKSAFMAKGLCWSLDKSQVDEANRSSVAAFCDQYLLPQYARAVYQNHTGANVATDNDAVKAFVNAVMEAIEQQPTAEDKTLLPSLVTVCCAGGVLSAADKESLSKELKQLVEGNAKEQPYFKDISAGASSMVNFIISKISPQPQSQPRRMATEERKNHTAALTHVIQAVQTAAQGLGAEVTGKPKIGTDAASGVEAIAATWWFEGNVDDANNYYRDIPGALGLRAGEHKGPARLGAIDGNGPTVDVARNIFIGRFYEEISPQFAARLKDTKRASALERALARAMMWMRCDYKSGWAALVSNDCPVPVDFLAWRTNIRHRMKSAIIAKGGLETGAMCVVSDPDVKQGNDAVTKVSMQHMTHVFGAVVWRPENINVLRDIAYAGYLWGNSAKVYDDVPSRFRGTLLQQKNDDKGTMVFTMMPLGCEPAKCLDLFGMPLHPDAQKSREAQSNSMNYPGSEFIRRVLDVDQWQRQIRSSGVANVLSTNKLVNQIELNTTCWLGPHLKHDGSGVGGAGAFRVYQRGCGHHGEYVFPGCADARSGMPYAIISLSHFLSNGYTLV